MVATTVAPMVMLTSIRQPGAFKTRRIGVIIPTSSLRTDSMTKTTRNGLGTRAYWARHIDNAEGPLRSDESRSWTHI